MGENFELLISTLDYDPMLFGIVEFWYFNANNGNRNRSSGD